MRTKPKVDVVIPAANEEGNILEILKQVLAQKEKNFVFGKVWVISDGSTDKTVSIVEKIPSHLIKVTEGRRRKGKVKRLNEVIRKFNADILVQLDADIQIANRKVISSLVAQISMNNGIDIVFGRSFAVKPVTFTEQLSYFGYSLWNRAIELTRHPLRYYTNGQIRAFSSKFISEFRFPEEEKDISEDTYIFYYATQKGYAMKIAQGAKVYFRLPNNLADYARQMKRFLKAPSSMERFFGKGFVEKYEVITNKVRFKAYLIEASKTPVVATIYLCLQAYIRLLAMFSKPDAAWSLASSSKKFKEVKI